MSAVIDLEGETTESDPESHEYAPKSKRRRLEDASVSDIWIMLHASLRPMQSSSGFRDLELCVSDPHFRLDFAQSENSGKILEHASSVISRHVTGTQRYKIGFTQLPHNRFYKKWQELRYEWKSTVALRP